MWVELCPPTPPPKKYMFKSKPLVSVNVPYLELAFANVMI